MGERDDARDGIEQSRDRMTAIAEELARRATPGYVGNQIKEATVRKTKELKQRAADNPYTFPLLGGVIGAIAGSYFGRSRPSGNMRYEVGRIEEVTGYGYEMNEEQEAGGIVETARELKHKAADKISDVTGASADAISGAKDRAVELGASAKGWFARSLDEQPLLIGAGLAVIGALAAMLAPVSEREKRLVEPARKRAADGIQKLSEKIEETLEGTPEIPPTEAMFGYESGNVVSGGIVSDIASGDGVEAGDDSFPQIH